MSEHLGSQLLGAIQASFEKNHSRVALNCPIAGAVSYKALLNKSLGIQADLLGAGVERGDRVVISLRRSAAAIAAMHATISLGAVYVPVAHSGPPDRLRQILDDAKPSVVLHDEQAARTLDPGLNFGNALAVDVDPGVFPDHIPPAIDSHLHAVTDESVCYLLYTSGSTGSPKGVMVTHANVADYAEWSRDYFELSCDDKVLSTAPFYFDMSVFDVYAVLTSGAELVIASEKDCMFPSLLIKKISDNEITVWKGVSSLFAHVGNLLKVGESRLETLRTLIFSGERLPTGALIDWMTALPNAKYFNGYGPTESTGISICYAVKSVPESGDVVPIGRPCTNTAVYIFDGQNEVSQPQVVGEVVIGGAGVAKGYWRDKAKTNSRFVRSIGRRGFPGVVYRTGDLAYYDEHQNFVFVSRMDRQVKYQGYRIELDEIESAFCAISGVSHAAVVHIEHAESTELVAFYEAESQIELAIIRSELSSRIPNYMIPKGIRHLDIMPRTERGKVDYASLESQCRAKN